MGREKETRRVRSRREEWKGEKAVEGKGNEGEKGNGKERERVCGQLQSGLSVMACECDHSVQACNKHCCNGGTSTQRRIGHSWSLELTWIESSIVTMRLSRISNRFGDKRRFRSKITNFPDPLYLTPPAEGVSLGIL